MSDQELDRLVRGASPVDEGGLATIDMQAAESELLEEILAIDAPGVADIGAARSLRDRRRILTRGVGAVAGIAACAAVAVLLVGGSGSQPQYAEAAVEVAKANPRLLIDEPGWPVVSVAEFSRDDGEMVFSSDGDLLDGKGELELHWYPARIYRSFLADRASNAERTDVRLLGQRAAQFSYPALGLQVIATVLPPQGTNFVEIRGNLGSKENYTDALSSLRPVGVDTWLAALPESAVKPDQRSTVVDEMLEGLPRPAGLDVSVLRDGDSTMNRYDLAALVSGAVACGWIDQWSAAQADGDTVAADEAIAAMQTSRDWPLFADMSEGERGGYPSVLWGYADAMKDPDAARSNENVHIRFYRSGLGCREAQGRG